MPYPTISWKLVPEATLASGTGSGATGAAQEANIVAISTGYRFFLSRGWDTEGIYSATSGPDLVPGSYTKILGSGTGGEAGTSPGRSSLIIDPTNNRRYLYYTPTITGGNWKYIYSDDQGTTWSAPITSNMTTALLTNNGGFANSTILYDGPGVYYALLEMFNSSTGTWEMYALRAASPAGPWTILNTSLPVTTLQVGTGAYGGPCMVKVGSIYHVFFHAALSGDLPTACYHATCTVFGNAWTIMNGGYPVIPTPAGDDQSSDPFILDLGTSVRVYRSEALNGTQTSAVTYSTYLGTLAQMLTYVGIGMTGFLGQGFLGANFMLGSRWDLVNPDLAGKQPQLLLLLL